jgi:hypothetical protein
MSCHTSAYRIRSDISGFLWNITFAPSIRLRVVLVVVVGWFEAENIQSTKCCKKRRFPGQQNFTLSEPRLYWISTSLYASHTPDRDWNNVPTHTHTHTHTSREKERGSIRLRRRFHPHHSMLQISAVVLRIMLRFHFLSCTSH